MCPTKTLVDRPYVSDEKQDMTLDHLIEALQRLRSLSDEQRPKSKKNSVPVLCMFLKSLTYHIEKVSLEDRPTHPLTKDTRETVVLYLK